LRTLVEHRREEIKAAVARHHGLQIALFGSVARGDASEESDVDFLVDFQPDSSLFDLLHLQDELQAILGCPVDVVSVRALKPCDKDVPAEAVPLCDPWPGDVGWGYCASAACS